VHTITEAKKVLAIMRDDGLATFKTFSKKIPNDKVKEVYIDVKEALRMAAKGRPQGQDGS